MTPEELLAREPETVTHSLNYLVGYRYDHIPEARLDLSTGWGLESPRVEVRSTSTSTLTSEGTGGYARSGWITYL